MLADYASITRDMKSLFRHRFVHSLEEINSLAGRKIGRLFWCGTTCCCFLTALGITTWSV
jgi:hypothetical protein